jgi:hypothetical protein
MNEELEHLLELDPIKAHDQIMRATRPPPVIIHKKYLGEQPLRRDNGNGNDNGNGEDQPMSTDDMIMIDAVAQALAETRSQLRTEFQSMIDDAVGPLTEAVAVLQGQVSVLMNLIGSLVSNGNSVKEASETRTKTVRRVRQSESKPR